ncbi:MAG: hypothetical protein M1812_005532 [Candelaria pacifica]|nr:MAG: hypothetical protein M1812_005532 [Candelaria pacifica]
MDIANKLFSLTLGVEPNKSTLKGFAEIMNETLLSLSDKQKLLDQYAETAQSQTYTAAAKPPTPKPKIIYRDKKEIKVFKIDPAKLKELQWKRTQLLAAAKAQKEADAAAGKAKGKATSAAAKPKQLPAKAPAKAPAKPQAPKTPKAPEASQAKSAPQKARKPSVATNKSSQMNGAPAKAQKSLPNGKAK